MESKRTGDDQDPVLRDRKERGEARDAHLDAAREQAQKANAEARERSQTGPLQSLDEAETGDQAQPTAQRGTDEATMKAQVRARYEGTDESFEEEWPSIRERLLNEDVQKGVERIRRRL